MNRVSNSVMKDHVGKIFTGSTHWGCTTPYFYRLEKLVGEKSVLLKRLHIVYDSEYGPNGDYLCVPKECVEKNPEKYPGKWYDVGRDYESGEVERCFIYENEVFEGMYYINVPSGPLLRLWDDTPQGGNCD